MSRAVGVTPAISGRSATRPVATEKQFQALVLDIARALQWRAYHTFDSRRSAGGWPDLVLVRERVIFAELKREGESPRPDQVEWLNALASAGAEVYVWTLADFDEIASILSPVVPRAEGGSS